LLVVGYDDNGSHVYQTCPSANSFDCKAMAIGARSQSARTYLEKHRDEFSDSTLEELIKHGLRALRDTLPNDVDLTTKNCSIAVVGKGTRFTIYDDDAVAPFLAGIEGEERKSGPPPPGDDVPMDEERPPAAAPAPGGPEVATAAEERMHID